MAICSLVNSELAGKDFPPEKNGGAKGGGKNYGGRKFLLLLQGWENDVEWAGPTDPVPNGGFHAAPAGPAIGVIVATVWLHEYRGAM